MTTLDEYARHFLKAKAVLKKQAVKKNYSKDKASIVEGTKGLIEAIEIRDLSLPHPLPSTASKHFLLGQGLLLTMKPVECSRTPLLSALEHLC